MSNSTSKLATNFSASFSAIKLFIKPSAKAFIKASIKPSMFTAALVVSATLLIASGCTVHRLDIQQGNIIKDEMVNQLKIGSSKRQVRYVMGSPMLTDPFHANRWDYVFTDQPGNKRKIIERHHISVYFENDKLVKVVTEASK